MLDRVTRNSPNGRTLAVFDLDKTIIDTSASMAYRRPLARQGLLSTREVLRMLTLLGSYMFTTHTDEDMDATKDALTSMIKGRDAATMRAVAQDALQEVITPYIYAEARELLDHHRQQGHDIAIVTASVSVLVEPIFHELGADHLIASELEEVDGTFTGQLIHYNKGQTKVDRLRALAADHNYDLDASYAYTDSISDLPLLESVGNPRPVNPDRQLRKIALERDWPVQRFVRPEPLFPQAAVLAGAGATVAILGAITAGMAVWLQSRKD